MNPKFLEELRQKYIKNPSEGMTDSDLLDMHYFLTEDDDLHDDESEEGFIFSKRHHGNLRPSHRGAFLRPRPPRKKFPNI